MSDEPESDRDGAARVFISYARADGEAIARRVHALVAGHGLSAWLDHEGLEGGEDWWRAAAAAIGRAEHLVLLLTPKALASKNVEREWRHARQEGVEVSPVCAAEGLDASGLPRWMQRAHRYNLAIREQERRLLRVLERPPSVRRVPFMAPDPGGGFVERPEGLQQLRDASVGVAAGGGVIVGLHGPRGCGKTALLARLCRDDDIEDEFHDGVLWVSLGETPRDPVERLAELAKMLTGKPAGVSSLDAARAALAEALDDRRCLLVLDDAWRRSDVEPFLQRGPKDCTTRVVSAWNQVALPEESQRVPLDVMEPSEAISLLRRGLPAASDASNEQPLAGFAARLGHWPLLLRMAGAMLRRRVEQKESIQGAFSYLNRSLRERGVGTGLQPGERGQPNRGASSVLLAAMDQLRSSADRRRFCELAVFIEDTDATLDSVQTLWGRDGQFSELDAEDLWVELRELSLLRELDLGRRTLRLHGVVRELLRDQLGGLEAVRALDAALVKAWRGRCGGHWPRMTGDAYALRYLPAHLVGAGREEERRALLLDPVWMDVKLRNLGVQALLADYRSPFSPGAYYSASHEDTSVASVGRTLHLVAGILTRDRQQLVPQLIGRLRTDGSADLSELVRKARDLAPRGSIVPLTASLTPEGLEAARMEGHADCIKALAVLTDGHLASAGRGKCIEIWDPATGNRIRSYNQTDRGEILSLTVLPCGRVISAGTGNNIRVWDLAAGTSAVFAVADDDEYVISTVSLGAGRLALCCNRSIKIYDISTMSTLFDLPNSSGNVGLIALPGGRLASFQKYLNKVNIWDPREALRLREISPSANHWITALACLEDGRLAIASRNSICLWDSQTGSETSVLRGPPGEIDALAVLSDGCIASASGGVIRVWDLATGSQVGRLAGHKGWIPCMVQLADRRLASAGGWDKTVRIWNLAAIPLSTAGEEEGGIQDLCVLSSDILVSNTGCEMAKLWRISSHREVARIAVGSGRIRKIVSAGNERILVAREDGNIELWDVNAARPLRYFPCPEGAVTALVPLTATRFASAGGDDTIRVWDINTGLLVGKIVEAQLLVSLGERLLLASYHPKIAMFQLPDGRLAAAGADGKIRLWTLSTLKRSASLSGHTGGVTQLLVDPEGRLVSTSGDGTVRLWDLSKGQELTCFQGHFGSVNSVAALHRHLLVTAGDDNTLRVWDLSTEATSSMIDLDAPINCITSAGDGEMLIAGDSLGRLHWLSVVGSYNQ